MNRRTIDGGSALVGFAIGAVVTLLATVAIVPGNRSNPSSQLSTVEAAQPEAGNTEVTPSDAQGGGGPSTTVAGKAGTSATKTGGATNSQAATATGCSAAGNGGATADGVTAHEIKLGATVAESGIAQSFLGEVRQGMDAVVNKVNRSGGICGRLLKMVYKDDEWLPDRGATYLENLISGDKVFALAVVPSSEGLNAASQAGLFAKTHVPVVGSDGMIRTQYKDPYIWPVAAATTTTMHVIMEDAWQHGVRNPAIVYENTYRFGVEGAYAFNQAFNHHSGHDIDGYSNPLANGGGQCRLRFCGIPGAKGGYASEVKTVNDACGSTCDMLVLLLEPKTAEDWMNSAGAKTATPRTPEHPDGYAYGIHGAQPLFTYSFGHVCGDKCDGMRVWTGYNPPIEQYASDPNVRTYVGDLALQSAQADPYNQFTEGGYIGMELLVEALKRTGPNLTRDRLKATLDSMKFESGLTKALTFKVGDHFSNDAAQSFIMQSRNGFSGWRFDHEFITDPWRGQDAG